MGRARWLLIAALAVVALALLAGGVAATQTFPVRPAASALPDRQSDPNNCGAAHFRVPAGDICRNGVATSAP